MKTETACPVSYLSWDGSAWIVIKRGMPAMSRAFKRATEAASAWADNYPREAPLPWTFWDGVAGEFRDLKFCETQDCPRPASFEVDCGGGTSFWCAECNAKAV